MDTFRKARGLTARGVKAKGRGYGTAGWVVLLVSMPAHWPGPGPTHTATGRDARADHHRCVGARPRRAAGAWWCHTVRCPGWLSIRISWLLSWGTCRRQPRAVTSAPALRWPDTPPFRCRWSSTMTFPTTVSCTSTALAAAAASAARVWPSTSSRWVGGGVCVCGGGGCVQGKARSFPGARRARLEAGPAAEPRDFTAPRARGCHHPPVRGPCPELRAGARQAPAPHDHTAHVGRGWGRGLVRRCRRASPAVACSPDPAACAPARPPPCSPSRSGSACRTTRPSTCGSWRARTLTHRPSRWGPEPGCSRPPLPPCLPLSCYCFVSMH